MLQILKREDKSLYLPQISALGFNECDVSISEAVDGGETLGYAIYKLTPECLEILKISPQNDLVLFDGIVRSILFLAVLKGVERAEFKLGSLAEAQKLGFIKNNNVLEPISQIFGGCEGCKHNEV